MSTIQVEFQFHVKPHQLLAPVPDRKPSWKLEWNSAPALIPHQLRSRLLSRDYSGFRIAIPKGIHPSRPDPKEGRPGIEDRQGTPILKPL